MSKEVKAADLKEGDEVLDVPGVMEADAEPLTGGTHVRLHIAGRIFDKPAESMVNVGD